MRKQNYSVYGLTKGERRGGRGVRTENKVIEKRNIKRLRKRRTEEKVNLG